MLICAEHVNQYFAFTGENMKHSNDEHIETCHSVVNRREMQINAKSTRDHISEEKRKRAHRLITVHNSYNKKFKQS